MLKRIILNSSLRDLKTLSVPVSCRRWTVPVSCRRWSVLVSCRRWTVPVSCRRSMSSEETPPRDLSEGEIKLSNILKEKFPKHTEINVQDLSGGCGSAYSVYMEAEEFKGLRTLKRHQMVKEALKDEIKQIHALQLELEAPK